MPKTTTAFEITDRTTIRRFEMRGAVDEARLEVSWERWDGAGTTDGASVKDGTPLKPDYELAIGFRDPVVRNASWGTGENGRYALLSGTELDVRIIRAYATLLDQLADQVEVANMADAAYEREHDRIMRRKTPKR